MVRKSNGPVAVICGKKYTFGSSRSHCAFCQRYNHRFAVLRLFGCLIYLYIEMEYLVEGVGDGWSNFLAIDSIRKNTGNVAGSETNLNPFWEC